MEMKKALIELTRTEGKEKRMTDRQINIICAAIETFAEKGYEATSTSEIAKKAGVAEGTIFRYYKTKKDLLMVIPDLMQKLLLTPLVLDGINEIFEKEYETFEDFLRSVILNRKRFASENIPILKILFQELPFHDDLREKVFTLVMMPTMSKIINVIDNFKEKGQVVDMPSVVIVNHMFVTIFGFFFSRYIARIPLDINEEEDISYLIKYIMNGVYKAIDKL